MSNNLGYVLQFTPFISKLSKFPMFIFFLLLWSNTKKSDFRFHIPFFRESPPPPCSNFHKHGQYTPLFASVKRIPVRFITAVVPNVFEFFTVWLLGFVAVSILRTNLHKKYGMFCFSKIWVAQEHKRLIRALSPS